MVGNCYPSNIYCSFTFLLTQSQFYCDSYQTKNWLFLNLLAAEVSHVKQSRSVNFKDTFWCWFQEIGKMGQTWLTCPWALSFPGSFISGTWIQWSCRVGAILWLWVYKRMMERLRWKELNSRCCHRASCQPWTAKLTWDFSSLINKSLTSKKPLIFQFSL